MHEWLRTTIQVLIGPVSCVLFVSFLLWVWRARAWMAKNGNIGFLRHLFFQPLAIWYFFALVAGPFYASAFLHGYFTRRMGFAVWELFWLASSLPGWAPKFVINPQVRFLNLFGAPGLMGATERAGHWFCQPVLKPIFYSAENGPRRGSRDYAHALSRLMPIGRGKGRKEPA